MKLYVPAASELTVNGKLIDVAEPEAVPVHDRFPVPDPVIWIEPSVAEHALGFVVVPKTITGVVFTVTVVAVEEEVQPAKVTSTE